MDIKLIKEKLKEAQSKPQKQEKIDYKTVLWKPKPGKHQIRIVPSILDKRNPFREVQLHYGFAKFPIFALTNWGETDPIVDFAKELRKSKDKEDWTLANKVSPKSRYYIPVIVRGEEQQGTRLWEVGKKIYMQLLELADDEDYGDYTDILEGRDFTVNAVEGEVAGRKATICTITIKPKTSQITEDKDLLEKILNNQPDILAIQSRFKHSYDSLKEVLQKFLNPEGTVEANPEGISTEEGDENDLPFIETPNQGKVKASDKIDQLFN